MKRLPLANKTMLLTLIDKNSKTLTDVLPCSRIDLYSENNQYILKVYTQLKIPAKTNTPYQFRIDISNDPDLDDAGEWMSLGCTAIRFVCDISQLMKKEEDYFMFEFLTTPKIIEHKAQRGYKYEV